MSEPAPASLDSAPRVAILCGGRGTRIARDDEDVPKPLVEVGGRPILWHVMSLYAAQGFADFVLLAGWRGEAISAAVDRFEQVACGDWRVEVVDTGVDTPTGGRVARAAGLLSGGSFALTYADGVADIDLRSQLEFHRDHGALATISVVRPRSPWGEARLDGDDRVTGFVEKPRLENWINGGFMWLEPAALEYIGRDDVLERAPLEQLASDGELRAWRHEGFWDCMDTFKDAIELNELCAAGTPPWLAERVGSEQAR